MVLDKGMKLKERRKREKVKKRVNRRKCICGVHAFGYYFAFGME